MHTRLIIQIKDGYLVFDFVKSDSPHDYESYINLHSLCQVTVTDEYYVELIKNGVKLFIHSLNPMNLVESKCSHKYGVYTNSKALKVKIHANNYQCVTKISKINSKITEKDLELINMVLKKNNH